MKRARIMAVVGLAALAATVVLWERHHRDTKSREKLPQSVAAPTRMSGRQAVSEPLRSFPPATSKQEAPTELERVRLVVTPGGAVGFPERVKAIRAIQTPLTDKEVGAFSRYLRTPATLGAWPANDPQHQEGENWLRNEMLDKLVQQKEVPPGLSDLLVAIYRDSAQDVVMRDYAVQHMAPVYGRANPEEQARLQTALWQATTETGTSIAGTALLALFDVVSTEGRARPPGAPLSSSDASTKPVDPARLADTALKLAANDRCGELARITAVQVCGRMQIEQALPVVQQLAQEAPSLPLRIAATATLGDLGNMGVTNILARLVASADPPQALAAQSALQRISKQTGPRPAVAGR